MQLAKANRPRVADLPNSASTERKITISTTQHRERHYHVSATSDDGTQEELVEAGYLPALATARRLVHEARTPGGTVAFDPLARRWLVVDAQGTPSASIAVSGPCFGLHLPETPEGAARAA